MLDQFVIAALQADWPALAADAAKWRARFPHPIEDAALDKWHAAFAPGGDATKLKIGEDMPDLTRGLPAIIVQQLEEPFDEQPLGFFDEMDPGGGPNPVVSLDTYETVIVTVVAERKDLTRALHVIVKTMILARSRWLTEQDFKALTYIGGGDLAAERELLPVELGFYAKKQRWRAISRLSVVDASTEYEDKPINVWADDTKIGDDYGGVTPQT